jgi:hypothetical protein
MRRVTRRHKKVGDPKFLLFGTLRDDRKETPNEIEDFFLIGYKNTSEVLMY